MADHTRQRDEIKNKITEAKVRERLILDRRENHQVWDHGRIDPNCELGRG